MNKAFESKEEFKAWRACNPNLFSLLDTVIFQWRGSAAKVSGKPGHWAAYELEHWIAKSELTRDQVRRGFPALVDAGLIDQERHRFKGCSNLMWRRPTALAIEFCSNRKDADLARLSKGFALPLAPPLALPLAPPPALPPALTDYTSFPSLPTETTKTTVLQADFSFSFKEKGKGKAGEEKNVKLKGKLITFKKKTVSPVEPEQELPDIKTPLYVPKPFQHVALTPAIAEPSAAMTGDDELNEMVAKLHAKKAKKQDNLYPLISGPHEKFVKHPRELFPNWSNNSEDWRKKFYLRYKDELIPNWYKGKMGKAVTAQDDISDEEWATVSKQFDDIDYEAAVASQEAEQKLKKAAK